MEGIVQPTGTRFPDFKHLVFSFNQDTGYYQMTTGAMGFSKVPPELRLEDTQNKEQIKSDFLIRGRIKNGKYSFFTGLLETNFEHWYFGDQYEVIRGVKKNSFILFHFTPDRLTFDLYFFHHFKLYPDKRGYFIREFVTSIKK